MSPLRFRTHFTALVVAALLAVSGCGDDSNDQDSSANNGPIHGADAGDVTDAGADPGKTDGTNNAVTPRVIVVDLRADTNRDGVVDLNDPGDEEGEDEWTPEHGAIFLANLDDDSGRCSAGAGQLSSCHDAADEIVNGAADLADMARLRIAPLPALPDGVTGRLAIAPADRARLFQGSGEAFTALDLSTDTLSTDALKGGVELALEGLDVMRGDGWDGRIDVTLTLEGESIDEAAAPTDTVRLRIAPVVLRHHLDPAVEIYSSELAIGGDGAFSADLDAAVQAAGVPMGRRELDVEDQWAQDYFETGYMAMPGPEGLHVIDVFIRSANLETDWYGNEVYLRPAGEVVYSHFRGPNAAGLTAFDPVRGDRDWEWDTLNSFGNTETIPPYTLDARSYPLGRVIRGTGPGGYRGDDAMVALLEAQSVQPPVYVDTSWLLVAHIDETIAFLKADTPRGWLLVVNDAAATVDLLQDYSDQGYGEVEMFTGKNWVNFDSGLDVPAALTIDQALASNSVMTATAEAAVYIDEQLETIKAATGLTEAEIVRLPFLHMDGGGGASVAFQPGVVNGIALTPTDFAMPLPHGPIVDGRDVMIEATEAAFEGTGITVHWVEDWDILHRLSGEVHCGSNTRRAVPADAAWWRADY